MFGAFLLCGFSLVCSVALWVSKQTDLENMILAGVFATGIEFCKFAFFPLAKKTQSVFWSLFLYLIAIILVAFSAYATVVFLESGEKFKHDKLTAKSFVYQTHQNTIHNIDTEISNLLDGQDKDLKGKYSTRGYSISDQLKQLRSDKEIAISKLNDVAQISADGTDSVFITIAEMLQITVSQARLLLFLIGAILIDLCSIICLIALTVKHEKKVKFNYISIFRYLQAKLAMPVKTRDAILQHEIATTKDPVISKKPKTKKVAENCKTEILKSGNKKRVILAEIKHDIAKGVYGEQLKITAIINATKARHPDLLRILQELETEGICKKEGRSYVLVKNDNVVTMKIS